jgi:glycosyltransferase involved in cell wall biosynthesis
MTVTKTESGRLMRKVGLITGSPDVGRCGIHDYVLALARAMRAAETECDVIDQRDWSPGGLYSLRKKIRLSDPDIVHIQYPMIVGWRSLGPHMMGWLSRKPVVLTLHEFTSFDRLRQASLRAFVHNAAKICLTTDYETEHFLKAFPGAADKVTTIPIGSNIPSFAQTARFGEPPFKVTCFGQIKPGKGIEQFVDLIRVSSAKQRPWIFRIVGAPVGWAPRYIEDLTNGLSGCQVEWILNPNDEEAARVLADSHVAYLPYPDGISERRGSFLAALANGLPVVTTDGPARPRQIDAIALLAPDAECGDAVIASLLEDRSTWERLSSAGRLYVAKHDWSRIAELYRGVYDASAAR